MFKKLFGTPASSSSTQEVSARGGTSEDAIAAIVGMKESLGALEKREAHLQDMAEKELAKAKVFLSQKNKKAALMCMKKKTMYLNQADQLVNQQLNLHTQITLLENSSSTAGAVKAMQTGTRAAKKLQQVHTIENVEKLMEDAQEVNDYAKDVNELMGAPIGAAADLDEEELNQELEELEALELDEQLLAPAMPSAPGRVPVQANVNSLPSVPTQPTAVNRAKTAEELELEQLQAEMALA